MKYSMMMKCSLLSISLILTSAYAISAGIPLMYKDFYGYSQSSIEILSTIPAFSVIIMVLCSGFISKKIGKKRTVQLGLIIAAIFGVIPCFTSNYSLIFISRIMLGVGFGLVNALAVSLIGDFFQGDQKATLMGIRGAFEALGQSIMTVVAANLLYYGWNISFIVYIISVPVLVLFTLFVPNPDSKNLTHHEQNNINQKQKINMHTIVFSLFLFIFVIFYIALFVRFSDYFTSKGFGDVTNAGNILSLVTVGGMLSGFAFGFIYKLIKTKTVLLGIILMSVGFLIIANTNNRAILCIGAVLIGVSFPITVAYIFNLISVISPPGSEVLVASFLLVGCNLGALLAPYGLKITSFIFDRTQLIFSCYGYLALVIGACIYFYITIFKINPR